MGTCSIKRPLEKFPIEIQVAHFTPSFFPLMPMITKKTSTICKSSWDLILSKTLVDESGSSISGMSLFYNEFYQRLDLFDSSGTFDKILSQNNSGQNKIAAKGAIIIRIIKFILMIEQDSPSAQNKLISLGKSHSTKGIRPWQYSIFVQTLLLTIASRLETDAGCDVMEAWVHLFAYVMKYMLPPAIHGQVDIDELFINTSEVREYVINKNKGKDTAKRQLSHLSPLSANESSKKLTFDKKFSKNRTQSKQESIVDDDSSVNSVSQTMPHSHTTVKNSWREGVSNIAKNNSGKYSSSQDKVIVERRSNSNKEVGSYKAAPGRGITRKNSSKRSQHDSNKELSFNASTIMQPSKSPLQRAGVTDYP